MIADTKNIAPCPLCTCRHRAYVLSKHQSRVVLCTNCGLLEDVNFIPQQTERCSYSKKSLSRVQSLSEQSKDMVTLITTKGGSKSLQAVLEELCGPDRLRVVDFGSLAAYPGGSGSVIVDDHLFDQADPLASLRVLRERLHESQALVFLVELVGGKHRGYRKSLVMREAPARFWPDWSTLHKLLLAAHFHHIWLSNPEDDRNGSELAVVSARIGAKRERPLVSVIMPVFNEVNTFTEAINRVLAKELADADIEVIIVESNSTDGTKQLVARYEGREKIAVIWQKKPKGKGHAVREGLAASRGDIILIQDADLEYDVNDYDALIEELTAWRASFVLGSRHVGDWKMRKFNDMPIIAHLFNFAHIFFVGFMNFLLGATMKDPFTMYKVFYRDCIYGLNFHCDRFDFDHELVIKLYRKGFHPVEIPVNYQARSFAEGKKVTVFKDGIYWILKDLRLAAEPLGNSKPLLLP